MIGLFNIWGMKKLHYGLLDIENWNKKHGIMWILYGIAIVIGIVGGLIVGDSPLLVVIYCGSLLLPIVIMVLYHKKLVKDYIIE